MASHISTEYKKLIHAHLPESLHEMALQYVIDHAAIEVHSDIVILILESKALKKPEEKQNWFNLMPMMNDTQLKRLEEILQKEKQKLKEIEEKYAKKKTEIKRKYLAKWQQMGAVKKMQSIREQEEAERQKEEAGADNLLHDL